MDVEKHSWKHKLTSKVSLAKSGRRRTNALDVFFKTEDQRTSAESVEVKY